MCRLVFDIEANGLYLYETRLTREEMVDTIWIITALDIDSGKVHVFSDYDTTNPVEPLDNFKTLFSSATALIGHNIIDYDLPVLEALTGWSISEDTQVFDTLILSKMLNYWRFNKRHSLAEWGEFLGHPKPEQEQWEYYEDSIYHRNIADVMINHKVYDVLCDEYAAKVDNLPEKQVEYFKRAVQVEHKVAEFGVLSRHHGWKFDLDAAKKLEEAMQEAVDTARGEIEPKMGYTIKPKDASPTFPFYRKNGYYKAFTARYFGIDPSRALEDDPIVGRFSRLKYIEPNLQSVEQLKAFLFRLGWKPIKYNFDFKNGKKVKGSPSLCKPSLEALGPIGSKIVDFKQDSSRLGYLRKYILNTDEDHIIRGGLNTIGTETGRCGHKVIANIAGSKAKWGKEVRQLFQCKEGYKVIGADSASNQMRGLCHFLNDDNFTKLVLDGSIHERNGTLLGCDASTAKTWVYAFLYGASPAKLGEVLTGAPDKETGLQSIDIMQSSIPNLKSLIDKLEKAARTNYRLKGKYSIRTIDGRDIYMAAPRLALNYLLQSTEAITCKAAVAYAMKEFKEKNIDAYPLIFVHDEQEWAVREDQAEEALEILIASFREAPKEFGVTVMDGDGAIGDSWYDVH